MKDYKLGVREYFKWYALKKKYLSNSINCQCHRWTRMSEILVGMQ